MYFFETCCKIRDSAGRGVVLFGLNRPQYRYIREVHERHPTRDIVGKSRKWGFTTLRCGLALYGVMFRPGRTARIVSHKQASSLDIAKIIKLLYESAQAFFTSIGEDWRYFLPVNTSDRQDSYDFKSIRSDIRVDTASGRGVGRSDRIDDVYCVELADWERRLAEDALSTLITSQPVGAETRLTVDFNANENWVSSHAYTVWDEARKEHTDDDWNGFESFFSGTDDFKEFYTEPFLAERRRALTAKRFLIEYPRTPDDLYVQRDIAVHDSQLVDAAVTRTGGRYLCDVLTAGELQGLRVVHGVDTATGSPEGDWQACVSFGWHDGMWWELCKPIHTRIPEDVFAGMVDKVLRGQSQGIGVVERNVGSAVLQKLKELDTKGLYRHRQRDKTGKQYRQLGYPTTYGNKRAMIATANEMLAAGEVGLVTPAVIQEWREVEWKHREDGSEGTGLAGAPDRKAAHDDLWMGCLLAFQGVLGFTGEKMASR